MNNTITDVGCILGQSKIEGETQILSCLRSSKKTNMSIFPTSVLKKPFTHKHLSAQATMGGKMEAEE